MGAETAVRTAAEPMELAVQPQAISPPMATGGWLSDFGWRDGGFLVKKTRHVARIDHHLLVELANWVGYLLLLAVVVPIARLRRRQPMSIRYSPDLPRPWYLLRGAALWAGLSVAATEAQADATFYFDDVTRAESTLPLGPRRFNFACTDVSKSYVAAVFERVFGYPLALDPITATGPIVEKSEANGVHDGRVIQAPVAPRAGYVYQRFVDTTDNAGLSRDLRTPCVGGEPVVVVVKEKPAGARFTINNRRAVLREPADIFSPKELAAIRRFNAAMGLDWGGLDILRDRDGRIYVVDVNKTDLGPVVALSWGDKIRSMNRLSAALEQLVAKAADV